MTTRHLLTLSLLLRLVVASPLVPGQGTVCVDPPDNRLGFPSLEGGTWNLGGYSLTADGLEVYYDVWTGLPGPDQPEGVAQENDWILRYDGWIARATRESTDDPFAGGEALEAPVNRGPRKRFRPWISTGGKVLYFSDAYREGGAGWFDIWVAVKDDPATPGFDRVLPLPDLNTVEAEALGSVSPTGTELFFVRAATGIETRLWRARFVEPHEPLAGFTDIEKIAELDGPWQVLSPALSPDGRYLFWSDRPPHWVAGMPARPCGAGSGDLWMAVRPSTEWDVPFGPPIHVPVVNDLTEQLSPSVWQDTEGTGETPLIYSSGTGGGGPLVSTVRFGTHTEPRARFRYQPAFPVVGDEIEFDASSSSLPPGDFLEDYEWSIRQIGECLEDVIVEDELDYTFDTAGGYQVTLLMTTEDGLCDFHSEIIEVSESDRRPFVRGDADLNGGVNLTDPVFILNALFGGGGALECQAAADSNDDDGINLSDATFLLSHLFAGGAQPAAPFPECDWDPSPSDLRCATPTASCR